jgi:DNA polymerase III delta subunit
MPRGSSSSAPKGNLLAAQQELEKLRLAAGGKRVDLAAVQASIGDSARFDVFQLGEAALGADVPRALRILAGLRSEGVEATLALWSLAREVPQRLGHVATGSGARLAEAIGRARKRQAPCDEAALRAARGTNLARRSHDQGSASRRRLGRNGALDRRVSRVAVLFHSLRHSPDHAPLEHYA